MRKTKMRILCLILAAMLLTACGKGQGDGTPQVKAGKYEILCKEAWIQEDPQGAGTMVLALEFTNNSEENTTYSWGVGESCTQNDQILEPAALHTGEEAVKNRSETVAPGETISLQTAFLLKDDSSPVQVEFRQLFTSKTGKCTLDPAALTRKAAPATEPATQPVPVTEPVTTEEGAEDALLSWWNGDWYGWWTMDSCEGWYEGMDGERWDLCGTIEIGEDYTGMVTLWDEDYTKVSPMALASVSLQEAGTGEHGTVMSEGGWFTDIDLAHADWIVDPGLVGAENMICIDGHYENGEDAFAYEIYLRPWGLDWEDIEETSRPRLYASWYLPMLEAEFSMPEWIHPEAQVP